MLNESQVALLEQLTDEFVDGQTIVDEEQVVSIIEEIESNPNVYDRWNVWNSTPGASTPVTSGSSQIPPACQQDGNSPCASCDCC